MRSKASRLAGKVALIYIIVAGSWILFSDRMVEVFVPDPRQQIFFSIIKGWGFVLLMGGGLYEALRRLLLRWEREATEREAAAHLLRRTERALTTISACNQALVRATTEAALLEEVCRIIVEKGAYRLAWVGFGEADAAQSIRVVAQAGYDEGYLASLNLTWADTERGQDPTGVALRTGKMAQCHNFKTHPTMTLWRAEATKRGYGSSIALPLRNGKSLGVLTIYSAATEAFQPTEVELLTELANDLAYGIQALRTRVEHQQAESALRESGLELRAMAEAMPQIVWACQGDGQNIYFNQQWVDYTGLTLAESYGTGWNKPFHPDDQLRAWEAWRDATQKHVPYTLECRLRRADGTYRWWLIRGKPLRDTAGQVLKWFGTCTDIEDLKQTEESLRISDLAFKAVSQGIIISDAQQVIRSTNDAFMAITGYTASEILGRNCRFLQGSLTDAQTVGAIRHAIEQGAEFTGEILNYRKDGTPFWNDLSISPVRNSQGQLTHFIGITRDITQRKQAAAGLAESEAHFRTLFEQAAVGIAVVGINGGWLRVNQRLCEIVGYSAAELATKTFQDLTHPDDLATDLGRVQQMLTGELQNYSLEKRYFRKDGTIVFVNLTVALVREAAGQPKHFISVVEDITQSKQTAATLARLATAVDQAAEAIVITDPDGTIAYVNPAFEHSTGYSRAEAVGQNSNLLKSGQQDAEFYQRLWAVLRRGEIWSGHFVNRRKDGSLYEEEATISPVRNAVGEIVNYVAVKRDVTREMQLENQFRQAQKMEAIGTLAGGIAHDFNNILAAMFGYGYLLQQDTEGNLAAQENITEILQAAARAKDLVTQILTFSRQREQKRACIRLDTVIKEAFKFLRASLPANLKIEASYAPNTPTVLADPTQIYQVAINLATNALHAMEGRPGVLTVKLEADQPDPEFIKTHPALRPIPYARLTISDTGHGLDPATLERIFEPFFTTKPIGKGTGLGLAVVHGIVQTHEGAITVASQLGQGTTFCLYFPAHTQPNTLANPTAGNLQSGRGQRILLVDDETALTQVFERLLRRLNYEVTACNRAEAAIKLFQADPDAFQLVITDLTMPEMNGLELAQTLRRIRPDFPIILASGYTSSLNREQLREAGISELLEKPVTLTTLAETVQRIIG